MNRSDKRNQQPSYIADHFNSLDQVSTKFTNFLLDFLDSECFIYIFKVDEK